MEPTPKKRSLFGFTTSLFRGTSAPASDTEVKAAAPRKYGISQSVSLPHAEPKNASFESPAKRASESQLASRKIHRPPSSKLSQTMSASDFTRQSSAPPKTTNFSSSMSMATPRRMPGDNPYKTQSSSFTSSTTAHTPSSSYRPNNFSGAPTAPKNLFRASMYNRAGASTFTPRVSTNSANQSFPPYTPGKATRGSTADINDRVPSNNTSSDLFSMRIPEPPRELTGEALAKEVPAGMNRSGSIYADEFLAHYCPPDLDEQQRRQFFCILDLRRLKYAADEVFAKKDWKINILNFAKEYEKSRSLIMLRYGLYEFKTVRASEAVKKEWKQKHGIASSEDEGETTSTIKTNGSSKRKAEEELVPNDIALTASSSNGNKRVRALEGAVSAPAKNKRKANAVGEADENQPAKLFKAAPTPQKTPSATKSVFESIVNNTTSTTPAKSTTTKNTVSSFGTSNSFGGSVFETGAKGLAPTKNIFGHLSDNSKGSNDDADAESGDETSTNADESEGQEAGQSDEPSVVASGGVFTPQFGDPKPIGSMNGTSSASSDSGEASQGRSLFDRVTRGADGQPVRQLTAPDGPQLLPASDKSRSVSPVKEQPTAPSNNTWNTGTPIKFSSTGNNLFGSTAPKPASTLDFGASKTAESAAPAKNAPKETAAPNMFAAMTKKADTPATPPVAADKPSTSQSAFGFPPKTADTSSKTPSLFSGLGGSANTASPAFGSTSSVFGQSKANDEAKPAPAAPAPSNMFAPKPAASADEPSKSVFQSSTLFGSQNKAEAEKPAQTQTSVFGQTKATDAKPVSVFGQTQATDSKPVSVFGQTQATDGKPVSVFGQTQATDAKPQTNSMFGASTSAPLFGGMTSSASTSEADQPQKKRAFGGDDNKPASSPFSFSSATTQKAHDASTPKPLFGSSVAPPAPMEFNNLFGGMSATTSAPAQEATPLFGGFGATTSSAPQESKSVFGSIPAQTEAPKPANIFGGAVPASATPGFSFGSAHMPAAPASQPATTQPGGSIFGAAGSSFIFSTAGSDTTAINNPFASNGAGSVSAPSSFNFGAGGSNEAGSSFSFGNTSAPANNEAGSSFSFGNTSAPAISFSGASDTSTQPGNMFGGNNASGGSMFSFGAIQPPSAAPPMFGGGLAPGGGTSTGTNTPFTFGGASSLATTPATGTPEPAAAEAEETRGTNADGDEAPQEQISLTDGGPGEEDEDVVYEVRAKALKYEPDSGDNGGKSKSPWSTKGVGPMRLMKHKSTGAVRILLRGEPRGHVVLNKILLPNSTYKAEPGGKYVKVTTASDDGKSLEMWMLQVKSSDMGEKLAGALEANKKANEKK